MKIVIKITERVMTTFAFVLFVVVSACPIGAYAADLRAVGVGLSDAPSFSSDKDLTDSMIPGVKYYLFVTYFLNLDRSAYSWTVQVKLDGNVIKTFTDDNRSFTGAIVSALETRRSKFVDGITLSSGEHVLTLTLDTGNQVAETNENNNTLTRRFFVGSAAAVAPSISVHPATQSVTLGSTARFNVVAAGSSPLSYQWRKNGVNLSDGSKYSGVTTSTLTVSNAQTIDAGDYSVLVSNAWGSVTSQAAKLTVNPAVVAPTISAHPANQSVTAGASVKLSVIAGGTAPLTFQWRRNGVNLVDGAKYNGVTTSTLSINNAQTSDGGDYVVAVMNSAGSITSQPAVLTVVPSTSTDPAPDSIVGFTIEFTITSASEPSDVGGKVLATFSTSSYSIPETQFTFAETGTYTYVKQAASEAKGTSLAATGVLTGLQRVLQFHFNTADQGTFTFTASSPEFGTETGSGTFVVIKRPAFAVVKGDFGGDGRSDILFQDSGGYLAVWHMNGANLASAGFLEPKNVGETGYRIAATGDFDADGKEDILFQHTDGTLAVWFMNGSRLVNGRLLSPANPGDRNWRVAGAADMDGDRKTDLIFQYTDGSLATWYMDGIKLREAALFPKAPGDLRWRVVGIGDFNVDGWQDLVFQHDDGTLAVWLLNGLALIQPSLLSPANPGVGWRIAGVADRNGDSKPDLLFQHTNLDLAVWFMDGTRLGSPQYPNPRNPGSTWKVVAPK